MTEGCPASAAPCGSTLRRHQPARHAAVPCLLPKHTRVPATAILCVAYLASRQRALVPLWVPQPTLPSAADLPALFPRPAISLARRGSGSMLGSRSSKPKTGTHREQEPATTGERPARGVCSGVCGGVGRSLPPGQGSRPGQGQAPSLGCCISKGQSSRGRDATIECYPPAHPSGLLPCWLPMSCPRVRSHSPRAG